MKTLDAKLSGSLGDVIIWGVSLWRRSDVRSAPQRPPSPSPPSPRLPVLKDAVLLSPLSWSLPCAVSWTCHVRCWWCCDLKNMHGVNGSQIKTRYNHLWMETVSNPLMTCIIFPNVWYLWLRVHINNLNDGGFNIIEPSDIFKKYDKMFPWQKWRCDMVLGLENLHQGAQHEQTWAQSGW